MDGLGLGYEVIRELNPDVVYASLSGFGTEGPYRDRSAYDTVIQAYAGLATNQADPANGVPVFLRQTAADKITALYASQAITAALLARAMGRGGQHIELAMMDAVTSFLWADSAGNEVLLESDHTQNSSFVAGFQPMRFTDGWGIVTPTSVADFAGMCKALDVDGWDDPRISTLEERNRNRDFTAVLVDLCYAHAANLTTAEATERLGAQRVPFAMVLSPDELTRDPHAVEVGMFEDRYHHVVGRIRIPRHPTRFGGTPVRATDASPRLGEQTDEILTELGMADHIATLRGQRIVA